MTSPIGPHLTQAELAKRLYVSPETVKSWRYRGGGPDFIRVHRRKVVYPVRAVEAWEKSRLVST